MNYNRMKRQLAQEVKNYLFRVQSALDNDKPIPEFAEFKREMLEKYGVGDLTIKRVMETYGLTVGEGGEVVKLEATS